MYKEPTFTFSRLKNCTDVGGHAERVISGRAITWMCGQYAIVVVGKRSNYYIHAMHADKHADKHALSSSKTICTFYVLTLGS